MKCHTINGILQTLLINANNQLEQFESCIFHNIATIIILVILKVKNYFVVVVKLQYVKQQQQGPLFIDKHSIRDIQCTFSSDKCSTKQKLSNNKEMIFCSFHLFSVYDS